MIASTAATRLRGLLIGLGGVACLVPDTLLVRLIDVSAIQLLFWRGLGVLVVIAAIRVIWFRGPPSPLRLIAAHAALLAAAQLFFLLALAYTPVLNVLAILGTAPFFAAVLSLVLFRERLGRLIWAAVIVVAFADLVIASGSIGSSRLIGDGYSLALAITMGGAIAWSRDRDEIAILDACMLSGLISVVMALIAGAAPAASIAAPAQTAYTLLLAFVLIPLSYVLMFTAPRYLPAPLVALLLKLELVLGPLLVWWVIGEQPPLRSLIGATIVFLVGFGTALAEVSNSKVQD